jgi:hypothetical protein
VVIIEGDLCINSKYFIENLYEVWENKLVGPRGDLDECKQLNKCLPATTRHICLLVFLVSHVYVHVTSHIFYCMLDFITDIYRLGAKWICIT